MRVVRITAIVLLLLVTVGCRRTPPVPSADQIKYVDVSIERALFADSSVHVLISARLRPNAPVAKVDFVHVAGYFVDQNGTRYSPGFARANNLAFPTMEEISSTEVHELRIGETYRYFLGPASVVVDTSSEKSAASAITKVIVYLDGLPPKELPITTWRGINPAE